MKEAQQVVAEKTSALEAEAYKTKRLHVSELRIQLYADKLNIYCQLIAFVKL